MTKGSNQGKTEEQENIPWTIPKVVQLQKKFDDQFSQLKKEEDVEELFSSFFGPEGFVEESLREIAGADLSMKEALEAVFELVSFRAYIYTSFFFNNFEEKLIEKWQNEYGFRSWSGEKALSLPKTAELKKQFDEKLEKAQTMADLFSLKVDFLAPDGKIGKALAALDKKDPFDQITQAADLFNLKAYIDYTLFAVEYSMKVEHWTDPMVRGVVYHFEHDLLQSATDKDAEAVVSQYLKEIAELKKSCKDESQKKQIVAFEESLKNFKKEA